MLKSTCIVLWAATTAIAGLVLCSCSGNEATDNDAGIDADQDKDAHADTGADTDADADADADVDTDADADSDMCGDFGGETECNDDSDCGDDPETCSCPKLLDDEEITSYCYPSCTRNKLCTDTTRTCIFETEDAGTGTCLATGYLETDWGGYRESSVPHQDEKPTYYTDILFEVGTISVTFWYSFYWELYDPNLGHFIELVFVAQPDTELWNLAVVLPFELFGAGTIVDFDDCRAGSNICTAHLLESLVYGVTITQTFVRAINVVDPLAHYENWVAIDQIGEPLEPARGTLKLFFAEYSAELPLDAGLP